MSGTIAKGYQYARGICPYCLHEKAVKLDGRVRGHECPKHPFGYAQGTDLPKSITRRATAPTTEEPRD